MKILKILTLFLVISFMSEIAIAANHYIRDGGTGNGSDWTNAWDALPATLTRGDTYYIADGSYGAYKFDDAESGSTYIYIKKAIESDHGTDTGWDSTYGDGQAAFDSGYYNSGGGVTGRLVFAKGFYDIDGQVGGGPDSWTSGHGFYVQHTNWACGIVAFEPSGGVNNILLRHMEIKGAGPDDDGGSCNDGIYIIGVGGDRSSNWLLQYSYIWYQGRTWVLTRLVDSWTIEYNKFYYNEHHWGQHSEGFSSYPGNNWVLRYNLFEDFDGLGALVFASSDGFKIYGNVFLISANYPRPGQNPDVDGGSITSWSGVGNGDFTNAEIHNNTFVDFSTRQTIRLSINLRSSGGNSGIAYNNVCYGDAEFWIDNEFTHDYNWFYGCGSHNEPNMQNGSGDTFVNSAAGDFHLVAATNSGDSTIGTEYNTDMDGTPRSIDGNWDMGAYELVAGSGDATIPNPPFNLTVSSQ